MGALSGAEVPGMVIFAAVGEQAAFVAVRLGSSVAEGPC